VVLRRRGAEFGEAHGGGLGEARRELAVRRPSPQRQHRLQFPHSRIRLCLPHPAGASVARLELVGVQRSGRDDRLVTAGRRGQTARPIAEPPAQPGHHLLQRVGRRRRRVLPPDRVDEPLGGDDLVRLHQQGCQ
jgi:hypothetical protein